MSSLIKRKAVAQKMWDKVAVKGPAKFVHPKIIARKQKPSYASKSSVLMHLRSQGHPANKSDDTESSRNINETPHDDTSISRNNAAPIFKIFKFIQPPKLTPRKAGTTQIYHKDKVTRSGKIYSTVAQPNDDLPNEDHDYASASSTPPVPASLPPIVVTKRPNRTVRLPSTSTPVSRNSPAELDFSLPPIVDAEPIISATEPQTPMDVSSELASLSRSLPPIVAAEPIISATEPQTPMAVSSELASLSRSLPLIFTTQPSTSNVDFSDPSPVPASINRALITVSNNVDPLVDAAAAKDKKRRKIKTNENTSNNGQQVTCQKCMRKFNTLKEMRQHMSYYHIEHPDYVCFKCNKVMHTKQQFTRHCTRKFPCTKENN